MSLISETSIKNFRENPNKIFFYDEYDNTLNGEGCLRKIYTILNFISENKIDNIGINSRNNIMWPLWYIAADFACDNIYIFNSKISEKANQKIKCDYDIKYIVSNLISEDIDNNIEYNDLNFDLKSKGLTNVLFTSGTTSTPKGVILSSSSFIHVAKTLSSELTQNVNDTELLSMPFEHSFGLVRLRCVLLSGCSALITDGLKNFPKIYQFSTCNNLTGLSFVPAALEIVKAMLRNKAKDFAKLIRYVEIGSSALSLETSEWLKENFANTKIIHHYGMTEASRSFLKPYDIELNKNFDKWIGYPIQGLDYKISYKSKNDEQGELYVKGKNLFTSYIDVSLNKTKIEAGWLKTGDICCEIKNKIFLVGRTDNQINIGSEKIQAEYIESIIENIYLVEECICFGTENSIMGAQLCCIVKLNKFEEENTFMIELNSVLKKHSPIYKPSILKVVMDIPLTSVGKKVRDINKLKSYLE